MFLLDSTHFKELFLFKNTFLKHFSISEVVSTIIYLFIYLLTGIPFSHKEAHN